MMQWTSQQWTEFKRAGQLRGFWKRRTTFYRDIATALQERELPNDFVEGELAIALATATQDKARAKGLAYLHSVLHANDVSLHAALSAVMPKSDSMALATLRFTRSIPTALRELAANVESQQEMTKMVRSALVSPMLLLPVAYVFAYVLSSVSIPEFSKAAPPEVWTTFNALVRDCAKLFQDYGLWVALLATLSSAWVFVWALSNLTQGWRYQMESARGYRKALWILIFPFQPVFSLYRDIQGTRMLGDLANLMQSGMLLKDALTTLAEGAQPWMRRHLAMVYEHLQLVEGDYVGAFSHGVLPKFLLSRMSSMVRRDSGGQFDKVLVSLGTTGMVEAREAVKMSAVQINAALLTLAFAVISFFYGGQNSIAYAIQDANSPAAVMRRQVEKRQTNVQPAPIGAVNPVMK